jgi:hypothetical protein
VKIRGKIYLVRSRDLLKEGLKAAKDGNGQKSLMSKRIAEGQKTLLQDKTKVLHAKKRPANRS